MSRARRDPAAWGIQERYTDAAGDRATLPRRTVERLLDALGADAERPPASGPMVVVSGTAAAVETASEVVLEDGTRLPAADVLPPDLPSGYHRLEPVSGLPPRRLIVAPDRCHLPAGLRAFGLATQVHAVRSAASWGIGDLADLRHLGAWAAELGAGFLMLSPLHAPPPSFPQVPSPYSPSSRRYRTPLLLCVEEMTGAAGAGEALRPMAERGRGLNAGRLIDRDAVWELKRAAAMLIFDRLTDTRALDDYIAAQGTGLRRFCEHSAAVEVHGADWRLWPGALRRPDTPAVAALARAERARVRFHAFLQWQVDCQLAAAAGEAPLVNDLAIGVDPAGADAWADQDQLALDVHLGAPPDHFAPLGQDWGLRPYNPWLLRAAGHEAFAATVRAAMAHAAGVRVDHVMGLFRLWWIPEGADPHEGGYVRFPSTELLAVLALESRRAGALVVGEDLGTVAPETRRALRRHGMLGYRVLWFEDRPPREYPVEVLAAVTTHDLPTVAGMWSGADLAAQRALGRAPHPGAAESMRRRVLAVPGVTETSAPGEVVDALHAALAASPARLVCGTLEDALLVRERPNMPGTVEEWPNWRQALPLALEQLVADPSVRRRVEALRRPGTQPRARATSRSG